VGWGSGLNKEGREVGYCIDATCDFEGCEVEIDRGLSYVCGGMHDAGWELGCGKYFCDEHRRYASVINEETGDEPWSNVELCLTCADAWEAEGDLVCEDEECRHKGLKHDRRADPYKGDRPLPPCAVPGCPCDYWQPPDRHTP
jgi:hypothetical protein